MGGMFLIFVPLPDGQGLRISLESAGNPLFWITSGGEVALLTLYLKIVRAFCVSLIVPDPTSPLCGVMDCIAHAPNE